MEKRWLTFFVLVLGITLYFQAFIFERPEMPTDSEETELTGTPSAESPVSTPGETPSADSRPKLSPDRSVLSATEEEAPLKTIMVETESYNILFSSRGGVPTSWQIVDPRYTLKKEEDSPGKETVEALEAELEGMAVTITDRSYGVEMIDTINDAPDREYPFEVTLKQAYGTGGYLVAFNQRNYIEVNQGETDDGWQTIEFVSPVLENELQLIKTYSIPPEGFLSRISLKLINHSEFQVKFEEDDHGLGIGWSAGLGISKKVSRSMAAMPAAVWLSGEETIYEKANGLDVGESRSFNGSTTWAGLTNRYFFASVIPDEAAAAVRVGCKNRTNPTLVGSKHNGPPRQSIEIYQAPVTLQPAGHLGDSVEYGYDVFVGPKSKEILNAQNHDLDQVLFYSSWRWFRALCIFFMGMLIWMYGMMPDALLYNGWGYSIIFVTILIKIATQPFVHFSMKANARFMKVQKKLKPELDELTKKHKDNPQKKNEETWKLYKKHNASPLGMMKGCVWMIFQMPIFIAFYRLLDATIELRGAAFWWIEDLSLPDQLFAFPAYFPAFISHFNLLPIVMAGTQILVSKMSMSNTTDPTQKQLAMMMPIMFTVIMYNFPSGMVLYWLMSNIWQIGSQYFINKSVKKEDEQAPAPQPKEEPEEATPPRKPRRPGAWPPAHRRVQPLQGGGVRPLPDSLGRDERARRRGRGRSSRTSPRRTRTACRSALPIRCSRSCACRTGAWARCCSRTARTSWSRISTCPGTWRPARPEAWPTAVPYGTKGQTCTGRYARPSCRTRSVPPAPGAFEPESVGLDLKTKRGCLS